MDSDELPPAVLDEKTRDFSGLVIPLNKDEQKVSDVPLNVAPLRMVPVPYGGNEPIPFSQQVLARLKKEERLKRRKEVPIPAWLKLRNDYVEGDWKAFIGTRCNGRKDPKFIHREYRRELRSENEVNIFMDAIKTPDSEFRGGMLQGKKSDGPDGEGTGKFKSCTRGGKTDNGTGGGDVSVSVLMPPGASLVTYE